ncbi:hypothetical protein GOV07_00815 [Candidatus Woesearchaeota archaeon]|nr:hypothetical protein [Candidatus Woesearchaeota archaeon]
MRRHAPMYASAMLMMGAAVTASANGPVKSTGYAQVDSETTISCVSNSTAIVLDYGKEAMLGHAISTNQIRGMDHFLKKKFHTEEALKQLFAVIGEENTGSLTAHLIGGTQSDLEALATELRQRGVEDIDLQHLDAPHMRCYDITYNPETNDLRIQERDIFQP